MKRLILLSILCLIPLTAQAEWYIAGDVRHNFFAGPQVDGTWKQDHVPNGSQFDGDSLAYGAGLGYRFTPGDTWRSQGWSIELGYTRFGSVDTGGHWVSDDAYRQINEHGLAWLDRHDINPDHRMVVNRLRGGQFRLNKALSKWYGLEPYASVGVFGAHHTVDLAGVREQEVFSGMVLGISAGGGVKYTVYDGVKLRAGVEAFWTIAETQHPVSSQWTMLGGGIEVPLTLGGGTVRDYLWQR